MGAPLRTCALAAVLAASSAMGTTPATAQDPIGSAVEVVGQVTETLTGGSPLALARRSPVHRGALIQTEPDSRVALTFDPRGALTLANGRFAILDRPTLDDAGVSESRIRIFVGQVRLTLVPGSKARVLFDTLTATIGVTGTDVRISVDERGTTLVAVYEGRVTVTAKVGGPPLVLEAGSMTVVSPGRRATRPASLDPAGGRFPSVSADPIGPDGPTSLDPENLPIDRFPRNP